ncbi:hypothetical protein ACFY1B_09130 [Streptomyces mirabilis]|uniref:hypothetical protein n=1 Tax=Streptomyces mirabilis TaxID=68239 RepID=UPI003675BF9D
MDRIVSAGGALSSRSGGRPAFSWADFLTHVGARKKDTPAFDAFDLSAGENNEFGTGTTADAHWHPLQPAPRRGCQCASRR